MTITSHMLVGAAIGAQTSNPWAAFCFGLISHYLIDILPHWDYLDKIKLKKINLMKIGFDFLIGSFLVLSLTWSHFDMYIISIAVFASILPDIICGIYAIFKVKWLSWHMTFHYKIHIFKDLSFLQGFSSLIIVILLSIYSIIGKWG